MTTPDITERTAPLHLPWSVEHDTDTGEHRIYDRCGALIACVGNMAMDLAEQGEKAAFIIEACNSYDALRRERAEMVTALQGTVAAIEATDHHHRSNLEEDALRVARALLARLTAKGQGQ